MENTDVVKMPDKAKKSVLIEFADETGLHGVSPTLRASGCGHKFIWTTVLIVAYVMMVRGIIFTMKNYLEQKTSTTIEIKLPEKFPDVLLCKKSWINEQKLRKSAFKGYADSIARLFWRVGPTAEDAATASNHSLFRAQARDKNVTIDDILREVSDDKNDMLVNISLDNPGPNSSLSFDFHLTATGPCLRINVNAPLTQIQSEDIFLSLVVMRADKSGKNGFGVHKTTWYLHFGDAAHEIIPGTGVPLARNLDVMVMVATERIERVSTGDLPCKDWDIGGHSKCKMDYIRDSCISKHSKPYYYPGQGYTVDDVSTYLMDETSEMCDPSYGGVVDACPVPCKSYNYRGYVAPLSVGDDATTDTVVISLQNPVSSPYVIEHFTATVDSLLGNLGGQISLWSGASLVTVAHVAIFWTCVCRKREQSSMDMKLSYEV